MMTAVLLLPRTTAADASVAWLHELDLGHMHQSRGTPRVASAWQPLSIAGQPFNQGVGTVADSVMWIDLAGGSEQFVASVGVDGVAWRGVGVIFRLFGDELHNLPARQ